MSHPGNSLAITVVCGVESLSLGEWTNTFYAEMVTPIADQAALDALCDAFAAYILPKYRACFAAGGAAKIVRMNWRDDGDVEIEGQSSEGSGVGDLVGDTLGDDVCMEIQRRTNRVGREHRGRVFLSNVPESGVENGLIALDSDLKTNLGLLAAALGSPFTVADVPVFNWRHWNRKGNALDVVTQMRPSRVLASRMDRRSPLRVEAGVY